MTELTERQERLMMMRDYFQFLQAGLATSEYGSHGKPWDEKHVEVSVWLEVLATECESDAMHIQSGQPEYCRYIDMEIPDLRESEIEI